MAIGSGGRYDNLIGDLAGDEALTVGGSIGLERVLLLLESSQKPKPERSCDVMVTIWDAFFCRVNSLAVVSRLRRAGVRTELFLGEGNLSAQLRRASKQGIVCVVLRGPEEVAADEVTLKLLPTGEQRRFALMSLEQEVQRAVEESGSD